MITEDTQYRGLAKVKAEAALRFACMNLKKLAKWKKKNEPQICDCYKTLEKLNNKRTNK
jgi:hypothetical protein